MQKNLDARTVSSFGDEWSRFDQTALTSVEAQKIFNEYFSLFPWSKLPSQATGFDMGCGSGRWAKLVAPRVGTLHCVDPSEAIKVAQLNLSTAHNVVFHQASVDEDILPAASQDFGYSLGVLHHVPDPKKALKSCTNLLKPGAPFLVYLYYSFDNRSPLYRLIWHCSNVARLLICRLPSKLKHLVTDIIAAVTYYPLARISRLLELFNIPVSSIPLSYYRTHSFYTMRTDSRDRFGTPLERRFSKREILAMMETAGLAEIQFSNAAPYWCAVGYKQ